MENAAISFANMSYGKDTFKYGLKKHTITSTPKLINQHRDGGVPSKVNRQKILFDDAEAEQFLIESKEMWPLAFGEASQEHLDSLDLNVESQIIILETRQRQCRGMSPDKSKRCKSRNRSLSPGGAVHMKESKWDKYCETLVLLIDSIHINMTDLSETDFYLKDYNKPAKELVENRCFILVEALRIVLNKLGQIVPVLISEQFLVLKVLLERNGERKILRQNHIAAVQTMLLNMTKKSRMVLRKLLNLFNVLCKQHKMCKSKLCNWLRPSLFASDVTGEQLKICCDLITLSELVFNVPMGLVQLVKDKVNSRICKGVVLQILEPQIQQTQITERISPTERETASTFCSFKKTGSPKHDESNDTFTTIKKRKSITEIAKRIYKRTLSPLKTSKNSYNIDTYYSQIKKSKAGDLYSI